MALPGMSAGKLTAIVTANTTGLTTGLTKASAQVTAFSNGVQAKMAKNSAAIAGMGNAFVAMNAIVAGALIISISRFAKFDKAMKQSTAVSKVTAEQYKQMSKMAEDASIEFNIAADKTAEAFYFLGSAGLTAKEQIQAFRTSILLAKAGVMEIGESTEILVDIMRGFDIPFTRISEVADMLTMGFISATTTLSQLGEAMKYVAGYAATTHNNLQDMVAVLGIFASVGIKGSMAGTSLRRALKNLAAPTSGVRKELDKYVDVYDSATGKMKSFVTILSELVPELEKVSEEERNMAISSIFGARAITGMSKLISKGSDYIKEFAQDIENSGGTAQRIADNQMSAFTEQLGKTFKILDSIVRKIGEIAVGEIFGNLDTLNIKLGATNTKLKENDENLTSYIKKTISYFKVIGKIIMTIFQGVESAYAIISGAIRILFKFSTMMDLIMQEMAIAVGVILDSFAYLVKSVFTEAWEYMKDFSTKFDRSVNAILDWDWEGLREVISESFTPDGSASAGFENMLDNFKDLGADLKDAFKDDFDDIDGIIAVTLDRLNTLGMSILGWTNASAAAAAAALADAEAAAAAAADGGTGDGFLDPSTFEFGKELGGGIPDPSTPDIWGAVGASVENASGLMKKFNVAPLKEIDKEAKKINQTFVQMGEIIKSSIANTLADAFMGAKISAEDFFKYLLKELIKIGIMMGLTALFAPVAAPAAAGGGGIISAGFSGLSLPGGKQGGLFQNTGGNINIPSFAGGVSGYQIPSNIPMDTMPVMVGGGEELDVRSIGQVSDRDNLLKQQIVVLNKIVTTLYATQTRIGDIAINQASENGGYKRNIG